MLLKDKVVIVSGIGPGLGVKLAIEAAREGARGVVVSVSGNPVAAWYAITCDRSAAGSAAVPSWNPAGRYTLSYCCVCTRLP